MVAGAHGFLAAFAPFPPDCDPVPHAFIVGGESACFEHERGRVGEEVVRGVADQVCAEHDPGGFGVRVGVVVAELAEFVEGFGAGGAVGRIAPAAVSLRGAVEVGDADEVLAGLHNGQGMTVARGRIRRVPPRRANVRGLADYEGVDMEQSTETTLDLRDRYAEAIALSLNGPASDGRGWYRTVADRIDCYARADAILAVRDEELERLRAERDAKLRTKALGRSLTEMEGFAQRETARADKAEAAIERVRAAWSDWHGRLGGSFPRAMVQEIEAAFDA